ncbi:class I SAM-dependent methyltransferase [Desulfogranum mediterraneum]|uniref:class I SAM-dependent methyltransferase n=1 Tax=Desulfogranum mediterraneum TaxID=160661 RepID=UPI00040ED19F|nr:class I SAM-dependent methyltransferase [Desulfogranum mediterraneum]
MQADAYDNKSSLEEIRVRFDQDVERFSNLNTGQAATMDALLTMELITKAAVASTPEVNHLLDIGCGAGNNTMKLLELCSPKTITLVDLSLPMLQRAKERIRANFGGAIRLLQGDFRTQPLEHNHYDVILAAAVLHHLRDDQDWQQALGMIFSLNSPGGGFWISDLVSQEHPPVQALMEQRYGAYLGTQGGAAYRDKVFAYISREDSPRPVTFQLDLLRRVGYSQVELLHKNACFAAFGAIKAGS